MAHTTLVDPATLAAHLGDPRWAVVDCRFMLTDAGWGAREYLAHHIPGARVRPRRDRPLRPRVGAQRPPPAAGSGGARPDARRIRHRRRRPGGRLRSGQRHVRQPAVVVAPLDGPPRRRPCSTAGSRDGSPTSGRPRPVAKHARRANIRRFAARGHGRRSGGGRAPVGSRDRRGSSMRGRPNAIAAKSNRLTVSRDTSPVRSTTTSCRTSTNTGCSARRMPCARG